MLNHKFLYAILMLILAAVACNFGRTPSTPSISATQSAATTSSPGNEYHNSDYGVRLRYPSGWSTKPGGTDGYTVMFISPSNDVYSSLWILSVTEQDTIENLAKATRDAFTTPLTSVKVEQDTKSKVGNGLEAWTTIFTGMDKNREMKTNITVTIYNGQAFYLISVADTRIYNQHANEVNAMLESISLEKPALYGDIPREQALIYEGGESTNLAEYDPATTHGSGNKRIFDGLVAFDPKLNLIPDLAESWDVSGDGMIYTFHIHKNARFHNGRAVTAQDFVYSWERAANPKTKSDTVLTYLGDIVGVAEMQAGKADHISGLKVIDDHTLQVTIDAPKPYFLLKLTYPTGFVVDKDNVETGEEWVRKPNGTGPYKLTRWDSFKLMIYERNTDYYLGPPSIPYIIVRLYTGDDLRLYETGEIDIAGVSSYSVPRITDPKEPLSKDVVKGVGLCTGYIVFDTSQPPFDDVKVRQAFALAFDRQQYIKTVTNSIALPAKGLYPPGLPGYDPNFKGLDFDPERAKQLLKESKYGSAAKLPPIVFTQSGFGTDVYPSTATLAQMWKTTLGVQINVENIEPNQYSTLIHSGVHGQIFSGGWCADYPDPENFADALFHTGAPQNNGNYSNPALDTILEQARTERDVTKRMALYQQAEQIIVQDAPAIFTTHGLSHILVKPYVKGYIYTPIDVPLERYLWLDWNGQDK